LLSQDTHDPDALEFSAYAPHAVAGTPESETVEGLKALSFSGEFVLIEKNSISTSIGTTFVPWIESHPEVQTYIVVGDCTDLCVYQVALDLRLRANVAGWRGFQVIVPEDCVQTYDLAVDTAVEIGVMPHDGDLLHRVFLYSIALNGVEVVARLA
jgi:nicotinamidase-related amidase